MGLIQHMNLYSFVKTFCCKLWALRYVPADKIIKIYDQEIIPTMPQFILPDDCKGDKENHLDNYDSALNNYIDYFKKN